MKDLEYKGYLPLNNGKLNLEELINTNLKDEILLYESYFKKINKEKRNDKNYLEHNNHDYYNKISTSKLFNIEKFPFDFSKSEELGNYKDLIKLPDYKIINIKNQLNITPDKLNINKNINLENLNKIEKNTEIKVPNQFLKEYIELDW